jgi:hypothetical protein
MPQRLYGFQGNDKEYIKFLESVILEKSCLSPPVPSSALELDLSQTGESSVSSLRFVKCTPRLTNHTRLQARNNESEKWKKQMDKFVRALPSEAGWHEARANSGINTPIRNKQAMKLILGHAGAAIFHEKFDATILPPMQPTDSRELVVRGCQYGAFISRCADDRNFAKRVVAFQNLVFCSYCVVMMQAGVSKETTNDTMRRYTGRDLDDPTLDKYRLGAIWVNRCMATLLEKGWGHKSWEIFLLGRLFDVPIMAHVDDLKCRKPYTSSVWSFRLFRLRKL